MELGNHHLSLCEAASRGGFPLLAEAGDLIGRGFADVGYELFAVLPGNKLLSVLTGEHSSYQESDRVHYFSVPEVDRVIQELEASGVEILSLERERGREWKIELREKDGSVMTYKEESLLHCVLSFYIASHEEEGA